jgi:RNA polymerase sigma-70 factor (ECF subfamily)
MMDDELTSVPLRNAIEVMLRRSRKRNCGLNELLDEAEDVRQEVATIALGCLDTFDPKRARPLPWLVGIAINVLRQRRRFAARDARCLLNQSSCSEAQWQEILNQLSTEPPSREELGPVWQALGRLSSRQQRLLRLRFVEERSYPEIAHTLRLSEGAVRARVCRALRALRSHLTNLNGRRNGE